MKKKITFLTLCALLFSLSVSTQAQQAGKILRIGYLDTSTASGSAVLVEAFRQELSKLGWIEGKNLTIEYRFAENKGAERMSELAADLVPLKVDLILAPGNPPALAAKSATTTIPIVMAGAAPDPVEAGFVESLSRPGGNVTGLALLVNELGGKRLELFKEAVPKLARVAVLHDPDNSASAIEVKEVLPVAARALGLTVRSWELRAADGFEKVFAGLSKERPDGLYVPGGGSVISANRKRIAGFALKSWLSSIYNNRESVVVGGLMSYSADLADSYRRVAYYVDRMLKGAKPADLPVEQPTKFELVINLKTAKQIGLTITPNVLARADKVIK